MKKILMACFIMAAAVSGGTAHADRIYWSIGINTPAIETVISNSSRVYVQPPIIYAPPPPIVYAPPPVVYAPPPQVIYQPPVVVYERPWRGRHHRHHDDRYWGDDRSADRRYYRY
ncbi:MAG: hypothetical protein ACK53K_03150 [Burkholderiales bacterium]|jgi:hypothetical protein